MLCLSTAAQQPATTAANAGAALVAHSGLTRGVAVVVGADDQLVLDLARASELLIYVRDPGAEAIQRLRTRVQEANLGIDRVVIERGSAGRLPFPDNMIDLVVVSPPSEPSSAASIDEVARVLRPEGMAVFGDAGSLNNNEDRTKLNAAKLPPGAPANWLAYTKPPLAGADDWTHWEHGPDNNPVSGDTVIRAPYMTQFMAHPLYIGMPSITTAAGGRTFLAIGHISHHTREWDTLYKLIARNGYNGTVLWQRDLPPGYMVHRSAFIATKDTFFMLDGDGCLLLDPRTGAEQGRLQFPEVAGEWKWMVLQGHILYVMAGKKEPGTAPVKGDREFGGWSWDDLSPEYYGDFPLGFGDTIAAYDLSAKQLLWAHKEETPIDSRAMALRDGKVFLFCPEWHLRSLSAETGEVLWTNASTEVRDLIAEPGQGLTSTPGFKSMCLAVATPDALIIQGQTRMNVVGISTKDGSLLWTKRKITNNPNAIFLDGKIVLGVGERGSHVALDPVSGDVRENLSFFKTACTRLTASSDSLFCRGEGTLRFDRETKKVFIDGAARPACNDGALPANGMLYIGPWQCDCNLSLIGSIAKCSAGDFNFEVQATDAERLEQFADGQNVAPWATTEGDWPTFRGDLQRSSSSIRDAAARVTPSWQFVSAREQVLTPGVAVDSLCFFGSSDGSVRAIDLTTGKLRWEFPTAAPIKSPPTIWEGRLYVGSGDGYAYCLEAATGRLLWRFRAAPVERHIMVYGNLGSTWPVNSGVLVSDGVAYLAAGIIDHDGTYVYALDAVTGQLKWQNDASGHLSPELRKGVSVQGNLAVLGEQLLLAGGNQVSPAPFSLATGELNAKPFPQGQPKANNGQFVGVLQNKSAIVGGRVLYSAPENVATKGNFVAFTDRGAFVLNYGGIPPAWNDQTVALVNFMYGKITCFNTADVLAGMERGVDRSNDRARWINLTDPLREQGKARWETDLGEGNKFEAVSLVLCPNALLAVVKQQQKFRSQPQWFLTALNISDGKPLWQQELRGEPLPGGLLIDRQGQAVVTMLDGRVLCFAPRGA